MCYLTHVVCHYLMTSLSLVSWHLHCSSLSVDTFTIQPSMVSWLWWKYNIPISILPPFHWVLIQKVRISRITYPNIEGGIALNLQRYFSMRIKCVGYLWMIPACERLLSVVEWFEPGQAHVLTVCISQITRITSQQLDKARPAACQIIDYFPLKEIHRRSAKNGARFCESVCYDSQIKSPW